MLKNEVKAVPVDQLNGIIKECLSAMIPHRVERELKLKYPIDSMLPLSQKIIRTALMFLLVARFPLLLIFQSEKHPLRLYDKELKQLYQSQLKKGKLKSQFDFQYFLLLSIKLCLNFMQKQFSSVEIVKEEEQEMYCLMVKAILGINVSQSCYKVLEQKMIDEEKYQLMELENLKKMEESQMKRRRQGQFNLREFTLPSGEDNMSKSRLSRVTMNAIQSKLQKRKFKTSTRTDRQSLILFCPNSTFEKFKKDLEKSLKLQAPKIMRGKQRYTALQSIQNLKKGYVSPSEPRLNKNVIHTEQISSSMKLNLLLENAKHSYTRRDIVLHHSNPSSRLTHRVYQTQPSSKEKQLDPKTAEKEKSPEKEKSFLPSVEERKSRNSHNSQNSFQMKNSKSYWYKLRRQLRQYNSTLNC